MSTLGTYTFLPWLRQGLGNQIAAAAVQARATVPVAVRLTGERIDGAAALTADLQRDIALYGPGDIVGIDTREIVKVDPRHWITNFETNYLPYIEFYDEDFPWRYTPAPPDLATQSRLQPWLVLLVLKEGEFKEGRPIEGRPLPYIVVENAALFPPADQLWAWAHVHVNRGLIATPGDTIVGPGENGPVLAEFEATLRENPDLAYSRIVAPRRLEENTGYHAFLIPSFETGRLAGLNIDPAKAPNGTAAAWGDYPNREDGTSHPVYHRWFFRTSTIGDFEYLVRLLKPMPMDSRVGRREMDMQAPGVNLPGVTDPALGGVLKLGGALQVPPEILKPDELADVNRYENWHEPYPHAFQRRLSELINLADSYSQKSVADAHDEINVPTEPAADSNPDPLITPPLYARWHALTQRLLTNADGTPSSNPRNWVHELNLDPRFRAAAGFGTGVIRHGQEKYMEAAWEQVGDVLEANRQIRQGQFAREVSWVWYQKHLKPMRSASTEAFLGITAPLDRRVTLYNGTRHFLQRRSAAPRAVVSAPMRRIARPRGRLVQSLGFTEDTPPKALLGRLNAGEVVAAPPKVVPAMLPTVEQMADRMEPPGAPPFVLGWLDAAPRLRFLPMVLVVLAVVLMLWLVPGLGTGALIATVAIGVALVALGAWLARVLGDAHRQHRVADGLRPDRYRPETVDAMPTRPDFTLTPPGVVPEVAAEGADSTEAARFKVALKGMCELTVASRKAAPERELVKLDLGGLASGTLLAIDPRLTIERRIRGRIKIPPRIRAQLPETFVEAMAYPVFDTPMYKPLADISSELFLPNLQYVVQNSISLLVTNQRFIESYMVGLNHEFGRELLWREYPTDQRGSYFRQFWDVRSCLDVAGTDPEVLKEKLRDIPPIHRWSRSSALGDHDNREEPADKEDELVLVIRGELLKKYPTAVIYARRAAWRMTNGRIDKSQPREPVELTEAEQADPPKSKLLTPLYEAKIDPDIYFFGFNLTVPGAKGETPELPDDPGWFFVIEERPGEPRFGLDIDQDGAPGGEKNYWNDVSWADVGVDGGALLAALPAPGIALAAPPAGTPSAQQQQHQEDVQVVWDAQVTAAELAYILYQVPVRVLVHGSEMLPKPTESGT